MQLPSSNVLHDPRKTALTQPLWFKEAGTWVSLEGPSKRAGSADRLQKNTCLPAKNPRSQYPHNSASITGVWSYHLIIQPKPTWLLWKVLRGKFPHSSRSPRDMSHWFLHPWQGYSIFHIAWKAIREKSARECTCVDSRQSKVNDGHRDARSLHFENFTAQSVVATRVLLISSYNYIPPAQQNFE